MITKEDILIMVKTVFRRSRNIPETRLLHPEREWSIGVSIFLLLLVGMFVLNAKRFSYFNNIEKQLSDESSVIEYKYGAMREVLRVYEAKEARFRELRQETGGAAILPPGQNTENASQSSNSDEQTDGDLVAS